MEAEKHYQQTIIEWRRRFKNRGRKIKILKGKVQRLEKEAEWLAEMLETYGFNEEAPKPHDIKFWREAARKSVEEQCK